MGLKDIGATLPPGFRFYPSDEELVCHYLYKKIANQDVLKGTFVEVDLHTCEPWQLPDVAKLNANEWYFFSFRDRKYATGFRTNRATTSGYWKATGKDRTVVDPNTKEIVGMRKTLVFYRNRAPNGIKTGWIMHEFRLENPHMPPKEDWVLCRVFHKSKGENGNKVMSPHHHHHHQVMLETSANAPSSSSLSASPLTDHRNFPNNCGAYHPQQVSSSSQPLFHSQNSLLNLLQGRSNNMMINSDKCDDDYDFLWDINNLEQSTDNSFGNHGMPTNMEEIRLHEVDNSSLVFL